MKTCPGNVLKACLKIILKTCLGDVLKTSLEDVFKMSCKEVKGLLGVFVSNKSRCIFNKSIFRKSIFDETNSNPKCINFDPIISIFVFFWNSNSTSILRIKISDDCSGLLCQLNSNSPLRKMCPGKMYIKVVC